MMFTTRKEKTKLQRAVKLPVTPVTLTFRPHSFLLPLVAGAGEVVVELGHALVAATTLLALTVDANDDRLVRLHRARAAVLVLEVDGLLVGTEDHELGAANGLPGAGVGAGVSEDTREGGALCGGHGEASRCGPRRTVVAEDGTRANVRGLANELV